MLMPDGGYKRVFWQAHEEIWVRAANTLCGKEREAAYHDIAGMTGRPVWSVQAKGVYLRKKDRDAARELLSKEFRARRGIPLEINL